MKLDNLPLFVIFGAMGAGKSTVAEILRKRKSDRYVVLNGCLCNVPTLPGVISECRRFWVDMCFDISRQTDRSVVFYEDLFQDCFDGIEKEKRDRMRFAALVCDEEVLKRRADSKLGDKAHKPAATNGPQTLTDISLIRNTINWGKNTDYPQPPMERFDTTVCSPEETADAVEQWILREISKSCKG